MILSYSEMIFSYELMIYVDYRFNWTNTANSNIKQMQSRQVANSLKIKVIKTQDKEIKLKDHAPRYMRSKS